MNFFLQNLILMIAWIHSHTTGSESANEDEFTIIVSKPDVTIISSLPVVIPTPTLTKLSMVINMVTIAEFAEFAEFAVHVKL